jgi:hypothetical protein
MITSAGIISRGTDMLGNKPDILTAPIRVLLGAALITTTGVTAAMLWDSFRAPRAKDDAGMRLFLLLLGPPCAVYAATLLYHAVRDWILFDRYLILLLPILVVPLLWNFQKRIRETPPVWGWAALGLAASFGIAMTHDYLAAGRARVQAAATAIAAGIPRPHISAGLEYDGWTQLEQTGVIPPASAHADDPPRRYPLSPPFWFWAKTPDVDPVYLVTYSRLPGLVDSQFPPIQYTAWLPPFHRRIFTQKAPNQ